MNTVLSSPYSLNARKVCSCRLCDATFMDRVSVDLSHGVSLDTLPEMIDTAFKKHIPDIPVGWSCNGRDRHGLVIVHCPNH